MFKIIGIGVCAFLGFATAAFSVVAGLRLAGGPGLERLSTGHIIVGTIVIGSACTIGAILGGYIWYLVEKSI